MAQRRILVADEDIDTRIILRTVLERRDFAIVDVGSGDEALVAASRDGFDLVILNYPMTCENGCTLVQGLRSLGSTHNVPIMNLTSRVVPQYLDDAKQQGVTVTVAKPIDVEHILGLVDQLTVSPMISAS